MRPILAFLLIVACGVADGQIIVRNVTEHRFDKLHYHHLAGKTYGTDPHNGKLVLKDGRTLIGKLIFIKEEEHVVKVKVNLEGEKEQVEISQVVSIEIDQVVHTHKHPNNYANPERNFQAGYIVLTDGVKLRGRVALDKDLTNYDFFVHSIFFLPEGKNTASTIHGGALVEFTQEIDGQINTWDGYADGYVRRLVDGRYRLCRNPYSSSKNEFFTSIKSQETDSLKKEVSRHEFEKSFESGEDINTSIENATEAVDVVEALGSIEIARKEYIIFDTKTRTSKAVNKDTYKMYAPELLSVCGAKVPSDANSKKGLLSWDNIDNLIRFVNDKCR